MAEQNNWVRLIQRLQAHVDDESVDWEFNQNPHAPILDANLDRYYVRFSREPDMSYTLSLHSYERGELDKVAVLMTSSSYSAVKALWEKGTNAALGIEQAWEDVFDQLPG